MTSESILIDSSILLQLAAASAPLHNQAQARVTALEDSGAELYVCPQVLREFYALATQAAPGGAGMDPEQAYTQVRFFNDRFSVLDEDPLCFKQLLKLLGQNNLTGQQIYAANLAGLMRRHGVSSFLTQDAGKFGELLGTLKVHTLDASAQGV